MARRCKAPVRLGWASRREVCKTEQFPLLALIYPRHYPRGESEASIMRSKSLIDAALGDAMERAPEVTAPSLSFLPTNGHVQSGCCSWSRTPCAALICATPFVKSPPSTRRRLSHRRTHLISKPTIAVHQHRLGIQRPAAGAAGRNRAAACSLSRLRGPPRLWLAREAQRVGASTNPAITWIAPCLPYLRGACRRTTAASGGARPAHLLPRRPARSTRHSSMSSFA